MKKIITILSILLCSVSVFGQFTKVTAPIGRNNNADTTYPTHIDSLGKGGFMSFSSIINRNALPFALRKRGMIAVVQDSTMYQLQGGIGNPNWVQVTFGNGSTACQSNKEFGNVVYDSNLVFHSTLMSYFIGCRHFNAPASNFTLPVTAYSRIDVWVVDTNSTIRVETGGISGLAYQADPASELEVAHADIDANATVPTGISNLSIYKENVHPPEWTGASVMPGVVFNYATNPFLGDSSTYIPSFANGDIVEWQDLINTYDANDFSFIKFYVRLGAAMTSGAMNVTFYNGAVATTNTITILNGQYGFNSSAVGSYQLVAIPFADFLKIYPFQMNLFQIQFTGTGGPLQFDNIVLQSGGGGSSSGGGGVIDITGADGDTRTGHYVIQRTDIGWFYDSTHLNADSTYEYHYNNGVLLDSAYRPYDLIFGSASVTITDTTVGFRRGHIFTASGISPPTNNISFGVLDSINSPILAPLPLEGSKFLVGTAATGAFAGQENNIATYDSVANTYSFVTATVGDLLYNAATTIVSQWTGSTWIWVGSLNLHQGGDSYPIDIVAGAKGAYNFKFLTNNIEVGRFNFNPNQFQVGLMADPLNAYTYLDSNRIGFSKATIYDAFMKGEPGGIIDFYGSSVLNARVSSNSLSAINGNFTRIKSGEWTTNYEPLVIEGGNYAGVGGNIASIDFRSEFTNNLTRAIIYDNGNGGTNSPIGPPISILPTDGNLIVGALQSGDIQTAKVNVVSTNKGSIFSKMNTDSMLAITSGVYTGTVVGGTGYTNGSSNGVAFTGGSGTGATGNFQVVGNAVQNNVTVIAPGTGYVVGDVLSASLAGGSGFTFTIDAITSSISNGLLVYNTDSLCYFSFNGTAWVSMCGGGGGGGGTVLTVTGDLVDNGDPTNPIVNLAGTLSGSRVVNLNNFALEFSGGGQTFLRLDDNNNASILRSFDPTDDGNRAHFSAGTTSTNATAEVLAEFNDGDKTADISSFADATISRNTYNAEEHVFNLDNTISHFVIQSGDEKYIMVDPAHDTIVLRHITAGGQESLVKLGDDNGTTGQVQLRGNDNANGLSGDYTFSSGGVNFSIVDITDNHRKDISLSAQGMSWSTQNTSTGSTQSVLSQFESGDHPTYEIYTQSPSGQSVLSIKDTAINIVTPLLRINGVIYGAGGGITDLNGETGATQSFSTSTTGTDFTISSAIDTHTFNIPTASASNRGLLSTSDWTTFNNKGSGNALTSNPLSQFAATTSAQLAGVLSDETGTGLSVFGTTPTLTTPVINGLATGTGVASAATVSTIVTRDANGNINANSVNHGYTTTATAAGTTTLTVASTNLQYFTGSTTQTVTLPVTSTLVLGQRYVIYNNSTGAVTINSSGGNAVVILAAGTSSTLTCILTSGTTAASWDSKYLAGIYTTGKSMSFNNTMTLAGTDATTLTMPDTSAMIATIPKSSKVQGTDDTTTLASVKNTQLVIWARANKKYRLTVNLLTGCDNSGGVLFGFSGPSGSAIDAGQWWGTGITSSTTARVLKTTTMGSAIGTPFNAVATNGVVSFSGDITTSSTAGPITMIFRVVTATQKGTVFIGSTMVLQEVQ